ncbi:hypothetical protein BGZ92_008397 [Podila epicladia]|nr:hypothetical protein BGZ92_008397 [Podila epicladia]
MTSLHLGLFLEALPNLEHLKVTRLIVSRENDPSCCRRTPDSYDLDEHNYATARPKFRLRVLEVEFSFLDWFRNQLLFTRLPHLQELSLLCGAPPVWNRNSGYDYQTQSFSLWLNHCCPELRSIRFEMTADLDFQGPPAAVMLPGLNGDSTTTNNDTWALFQALPQLSVWMRNHLHDHRSCPSRQDLFLNLTTFACIKPNPCSYPSPYIHFARDFLAQLSPTAMRTLTRIDLSAPGGTCYPTCHNDVFRHRRWGIPMQEITPLFSNDLQQLLETCTHLVSFRASGRSIHGHDMLEHPETDPTCHCPSNHNSDDPTLGMRGDASGAGDRVQVLAAACTPERSRVRAAGPIEGAAAAGAVRGESGADAGAWDGADAWDGEAAGV